MHIHTHINTCMCVCVHILLNLFLRRTLTNTPLNSPWHTFQKCSHHTSVPACTAVRQSSLGVKTYNSLQVIAESITVKVSHKMFTKPWNHRNRGPRSLPGLRRHCTREKPSSLSEVSSLCNSPPVLPASWGLHLFPLCSPPSYSALTVQSGY